MWEMVRGLRESGVTIILTTHYIEEAQDMADRIGIINNGEIILVEDKTVLMEKLINSSLIVTILAAVGAYCHSLPYLFFFTWLLCMACIIQDYRYLSSVLRRDSSNIKG